MMAGSKPTILLLASVYSYGAKVGSIATVIVPRLLMSSSVLAFAATEWVHAANGNNAARAMLERRRFGIRGTPVDRWTMPLQCMIRTKPMQETRVSRI